jgi:hypothetical protein
LIGGIMKNHYAFVFTVMIANQLSIFGMDQDAFHNFGLLEPMFQKAVVMLADDLSYIGQANKAWYAEVKKEQLKHIVDQHQLQDPRLARSNIPPFVFFVDPLYDGTQWNGKCAVDPSSRVFYKDSTKGKYPVKSGVCHDRFHVEFSDDDKYKRIQPTNLLIACLTQNEGEAKRLLRFYPLVPQHVIAGDSQSKKLYEDDETQKLFMEALCVSKMIPDNRATCILLEYLEQANISESSIITARKKKKEEQQEDAAALRRFEGFMLHMMPPQMRQSYRAQSPVEYARQLAYEKEYIKAEEEMIKMMSTGGNIFNPFSAEEEEKARKEFEEMILSVTKK